MKIPKYIDEALQKRTSCACNKLYGSICNYIFKVVDEREEPGYDYVKNTID